ncbi:hypothetical protein CDAR_273591 [Caerostris darwini]|uniref:Uncharacterized protein n=1 Tax=Caerostris darwini TaxID=1538125 RepID=A0AAV4W941_9ARAC|nr:hypothetical protein CDAR_273591 [Caerostris darwini]
MGVKILSTRCVPSREMFSHVTQTLRMRSFLMVPMEVTGNRTNKNNHIGRGYTALRVSNPKLRCCKMFITENYTYKYLLLHEAGLHCFHLQRVHLLQE